MNGTSTEIRVSDQLSPALEEASLAARRRFAWERAQLAAALMAERERRALLRSLVLWLAIVASFAAFFILTYRRCFGS